MVKKGIQKKKRIDFFWSADDYTGEKEALLFRRIVEVESPKINENLPIREYPASWNGTTTREGL